MNTVKETVRPLEANGFTKWVPGVVQPENKSICVVTTTLDGGVDRALDQLFLGKWYSGINDWVDMFGVHIVGDTRHDKCVDIYFKELFAGEEYNG